MASATSSKKMREESTCSICLNLMVEPVSISCGHSYCQACILRFLDNQPRARPNLPQVSPCPQCRAPFQRASLRPNKQLGGLIEALREMDCDMACEEHNERLQLFCEDEGQLICWRCERAPRHQGHSTALVEDVCPGYKVGAGGRSLRDPAPCRRSPRLRPCPAAFLRPSSGKLGPGRVGPPGS